MLIIIVTLIIFAVAAGTIFGVIAMLAGGAKRAREERAFQRKHGKSQAQFQHDYAITHGFTEAQWAAMNVYQRNNWIKEQAARLRYSQPQRPNGS